MAEIRFCSSLHFVQNLNSGFLLLCFKFFHLLLFVKIKKICKILFAYLLFFSNFKKPCGGILFKIFHRNMLSANSTELYYVNCFLRLFIQIIKTIKISIKWWSSGSRPKRWSHWWTRPWSGWIWHWWSKWWSTSI